MIFALLMCSLVIIRTKSAQITPRHHYDFCNVDLSSCKDWTRDSWCRYTPWMYVHSKDAGKCVRVKKCCPYEVTKYLFNDKGDCEKLCETFHVKNCEGEYLDNCADWHPSCLHGENMWVYSKGHHKCIKLNKCCAYGRFLFKNERECRKKCPMFTFPNVYDK